MGWPSPSPVLMGDNTGGFVVTCAACFYLFPGVMKRNKHAAGSAAKNQDPARLAKEAAEQLDRGRYKDAIEGYKRLIKLERRSEWLEALADAYSQRAQQLADKGMVQEAVMLWQNRAQLCEKPLAAPSYLGWLLTIGKITEVARLYSEAPELRGGVGIAEQLACAAITEPALVSLLPEDDPVVRDHGAVQGALVAWSAGEDSAAEELLGKVPFRSPYRDLRQTLKALLRREREPAAALELARRIPASSPFARFAAVAMAASRPDVEAIAALPAFSTAQYQLLAELKGWPMNRLVPLKALAQLAPDPSPEAIGTFLEHHQTVLGQKFVAETLPYLWVSDPEQWHELMRRQRYARLSFEEQIRLAALSAEAAGEHDRAIILWHKLLDELADSASADDSLGRALILRRMVHLKCITGEPLDDEARCWLEESIELDPTERDSHLQLIRHHLQARALPKARQALEAALIPFPTDAQVLLGAVEVALVGGANKKAARYARQLLAIDPINPQVRRLLMESHLGHARKLARSGKVEKAQVEFVEARAWAASPFDQGLIALAEGLSAIHGQCTDVAQGPVQAALEVLGAEPVARLYLALEAQRLGVSFARAEQLAGLKPLAARAPSIAISEVVAAALAQALDNLPKGETALAKAAEASRPLFTAMAKQSRSYGTPTLHAVGEALVRHQLWGPLLDIASAALQERDDPLMGLFQFMGGHFQRPVDPMHGSWDRLYDVLEDAAEAGDNITAQRIGSFIEKERESAALFYDPWDADESFSEFGQEAVVAEMIKLSPPHLREVLSDFNSVLGSEQLMELMLSLVHGEPAPPELVRRMAELGIPIPSNIALPHPGERKPKLR